MIRETDILHENGGFWVLDEKDGLYSVLVNGPTAAIAFEAYDDLSLAQARVDYLAQTVKDAEEFYDNVSRG